MVITQLLILLIVLILTSLAILGVHIITSGRTEKMPDGTKRHIGKLLYFVKVFLDKEKEPIRNYYKNACDIVPKANIPNGIDYSFDGYSMIISKSNSDITEYIARNIGCEIEKQLGIKVNFKEYTETFEYKFYKEEKIYVFSDYVKDPLIFCPSCMSSVWGTISYVVVQKYNMVDFGGQFQNIAMWLPFVLALVTINTLMKKIIS